MPTINDYKKSYLNRFGYSGDINTAEYKWLRAQVAPYRGAIPDMWRKYLANLGYTTGPMQDRYMKYFASLGYTGSINQRWYKFWKDGGAGAYALAIFGDSTAAFTGVSEYGRGWGWQFANDVSPVMDFYNAGVGGETTTQMLARVAADTTHRNWPTIFMDRPNQVPEETPATWIANIKAAAAYLRTNQWMVFPPAQDVPNTSISNIAGIQALLLSDPFFIGHTLDAEDQAAYLAAVSTASTRSDGTHFSDEGQAIQSLFASAFFAQRGWRLYTSEATNLTARFTSAPTTKRKAFMNALIERQKKLGAWAKRDAFYVLAAADSQAMTRNWIGNQYNLTVAGSPTFTADRGVMGGGALEGYLNTNFNPTTAVGGKFLVNDCHQQIWSRTNLDNGANNSWDFGNATASMRRTLGVSGQSSGRPGNGAGATFSAGAYPGYSAWARSGISLWEGYGQGLDGGGGTDGGASLTNAPFTVCAVADISGGSTNQIALAAFGGNLTATEVFLDYISQSAYLKAIGAA